MSKGSRLHLVGQTRRQQRREAECPGQGESGHGEVGEGGDGDGEVGGEVGGELAEDDEVRLRVLEDGAEEGGLLQLLGRELQGVPKLGLCICLQEGGRLRLEEGEEKGGLTKARASLAFQK